MDSNSGQAIELISIFRARALKFTRIAYVSLLVAVCLLCMSIYFYFNASSLALQDNKNIIALQETQLTALYAQRNELNEQINTAQKQYLVEISGENNGNPGLGPRAAELDKRRSMLEVQREKLDKQIANASFFASDRAAKEITLVQLVSTSLTRLFLLVTLVFLVQILVNLYKYSSQVSGHYSAIADSLVLTSANVGEENLASILELFSTNGIQFGSTPKALLTEIPEIIKAAKS